MQTSDNPSSVAAADASSTDLADTICLEGVLRFEMGAHTAALLGSDAGRLYRCRIQCHA